MGTIEAGIWGFVCLTEVVDNIVRISPRTGSVSRLDHCVISFYDKSQQLTAVVCCWVDDLYITGVDSQSSFIISQIESHFSIGQIHTNTFRYTGLQLEHTSEGILVDQLAYIKDIETSPVRAGDKTEKCSPDELCYG